GPLDAVVRHPPRTARSSPTFLTTSPARALPEPKSWKSWADSGRLLPTPAPTSEDHFMSRPMDRGLAAGLSRRGWQEQQPVPLGKLPLQVTCRHEVTFCWADTGPKVPGYFSGTARTYVPLAGTTPTRPRSFRSRTARRMVPSAAPYSSQSRRSPGRRAPTG